MALGRALIAVQIAASVPLIVGAALFLRTVANLQSLDLGFESRGVAFFRLDPTYAGVPEADYPGIYLSVLAAITAVPGVDTATLVENPLLAGLTSSTSATVDGRNVSVLMNAVGPGFFDVVGMKLLAGRAPGKQDDANAPRVAVVNEAAVRQWFGGASPIGRRFGGRDIEIVGIVSNSRYSHMRQDMPPIMFDAALQRPGFGGHHVLLRTRSDPATLEAQIRQAVARVSPDLPLPELRTQRRQLEVASATERIFMQLLTLFAGVALLLASIGLHGVTMHSVTRRTSEIGVRVALGARPTQVLWLILRQVLVVVAAGLAVGVPLALAAGPAVRAQLYGVSPNDAWLVTTAAGVMLTIALAAGVLPASRAARLDPVRALRTD